MFSDRTGQRVPDVTFRTRRGAEWVDVTSDAIFGGRTVVVFSLPGAFTPTCSSSHVPRFNQLVPAFRARGVDEVICVSVNDAFVMNQWQREQKAEQIGFSAYGVTRDMDDPVAKALHGLLDHSVETDRRLQAILARLAELMS